MTKKIKVTHDTIILRFDLPEPDMRLGIDVGQHIEIYERIVTKETPEGEEVYRKYTPISKVDTKGSFDLLVKVYYPNVHPKFPEGGIMSQWLDKLNPGDKIRIRGPLGFLTYYGLGKVIVNKPDQKINKQYKSIGLVGGGTGITPLYQIMKEVRDNPADKTKVYLLFANKSVDDILMKEELEQFMADDRFKISFTLDKAPATGWNGFEGFVNADMLQKSMPAPGKDVLICQCGPPMMNKLVTGLLTTMGYSKNDMYTFKS
eukprot:CAMPEP_0176437688 /NCGR_PEP_ID=MMETSP0127-20121128/18788_1 /TAXON_ID=938130 /ORGANISM="Platyophrya macrostoma, Strain WH" /LENGTH=259 /DNA_ID=CAMNT_0017821397 /DNA_START=179 /DNA_END=956 /DNA_ORIENTATION=-